MKQGLSLLLFVSILTLPVVAIADDACSQAYYDAETDTNAMLWLGAGFFLGCLGWGIAHAIVPSPPTVSLVGRSPEYISAYSRCYKRKAKNIQTNKAFWGCVGATIFWGVIGGSWSIASGII